MAPAALPQELYINRELSWIRFNQRVLAQALNPRTPLLEHLARPVASPAVDKRWLRGLYLDVPEEWDDPYRFFRW